MARIYQGVIVTEEQFEEFERARLAAEAPAEEAEETVTIIEEPEALGDEPTGEEPTTPQAIEEAIAEAISPAKRTRKPKAEPEAEPSLDLTGLDAEEGE